MGGIEAVRGESIGQLNLLIIMEFLFASRLVSVPQHVEGNFAAESRAVCRRFWTQSLFEVNDARAFAVAQITRF